MSLNHRLYVHSGLLIGSEMEIAEWSTFEVPLSAENRGVTPDVSIRFGGPDTIAEPSDYCHDVPGVGRFVIRSESEILIVLEPGGDHRDVGLFLTASAWGALCHRRGLHLLHGSAIRYRNRVFAFSGPSGAGKSSLAAWLSLRGSELIVDDTGRLQVVEDRVFLYPSAPRLKLWNETLGQLGREPDGLTKVVSVAEKYYVPVAGASTVDPLVLDAIYLLEWGELGLTRLNGAEALKRFLSATSYRPEFLDPLGKKGPFIQDGITIVSKVPIFELRRPRDLSAIEDSIGMLELHWNHDFT